MAALSFGQAHKIRVACVGDSITYGFKLADRDHQSYPAQLQQLLGAGYDVQNFGRNGATLMKAGTLSYWNMPEFQSAKAFQPDMVVIMLGSNDADAKYWNANRDDFEPNAKQLIAEFRGLASKPKVYVCLPTPMFGDAAAEQILGQQTIPLLKQAANETDTPVLNLHDPLVGMDASFPDQVHPNAEASGILALEVYTSIVDQRIAKSGWKVVYADSEQIDEGPARNAIDGDPDTYWHTRYEGGAPKPPHEIQIDLGQTMEIGGFGYTPRQDGGVNGRIKDYDFYVSQDGKNWGKPVSSGTLPNTAESTRRRFATAVQGRFIRLVAKSEASGGPWTTVGEIDILRVPPKG